MKTTKPLLLFYTAFMLVSVKQAKAISESEPNNSWNQSLNIPFGQSATGTCAAGGDVDWWKVTLTGDGSLNLNLAPTSSIYMYCQLYDTLGNILLASNLFDIPFNIGRSDLAAGTFYIKVFCNTTTQTTAYTLTPSFTASPVANDAGVNDTKATAKTLALNDSSSGHCGYYYNNHRDTLDWWKVITNKDGDLSITINPLVQNYMWLTIYDNNGTTLLASNLFDIPFTVTATGVAAGTYYVKIIMNTSSQYTPYKINNNLALPAVVRDVEPNDTKATGLVFNLNDSAVGHCGYYYNNKRDTADWYKITTNNDGDLSVTINPLLQRYVWINIYDNDGTTLLAGNMQDVSFTVTASGIAAGTYYVKISMNNSSQYTPYRLYNNLSTTVINDPEPNDTKLTAGTLNQNSTVTGHVSYYYNHVRDSADWYKITTTNDGQLTLNLNPGQQKYMYCILYDDDGVTVLASSLQNVPLSITRSDLGKGTYFVKVYSNSITDYNTYSLQSVFTSQLTNDVESNNYAKNANFIGGYKMKTGHVNYYYNLQRDSADWYKVGYFGAGNLVVTIAKSQHTFDTNHPDFVYKLYQDTAAVPIATNNLFGATPSYTFTHTGLAAGSYYIKLEHSAVTFGAYSLTTNYKDTASATIALTSSVAGTAGACNTGALTYFVTRGLTPYSVQLYLDGVAYGSPVSTSDTAKFTALPPGAYSAKVKCAGAITSVTTSTIKGLVAKPKGMTATNITGTTAIVKWTAFTCVDGFVVSYKKTADPTFISDTIGTGIARDTLKNLSLNTSYDYKVAAFVTYNGVKYMSGFTTVKSFTTLVARFESTTAADLTKNELQSYPNPVLNDFNFNLDNVSGNISVTVANEIGQVIKTIQLSDYANNHFKIDVSDLQKGFYILQVKASGKQFISKFIKE